MAAYLLKHLIVRITNVHNSCNADLSAPIFLANVHSLMGKVWCNFELCLMGKVWCNFEQNQTKVIKVVEQKPISQSMYYQ